MNVFFMLRKSLGWKLFLSYLIIILVGGLVLASTAEFQMGMAVERHIDRMQAVLGDDPALAADLRVNFRSALNEILSFAAAAAFLAAAGMSLFTARRIVGPIVTMTGASQHIAAGHYDQRVQFTSEDELGAMARAFNQMASTLELTEWRRMTLIGDVAHELRTPLSSIRGIMEGLVDGVLSPDPDTFLDVQREVARLQRLVQDLEELSRAEAGQMALDPRPIAATDLVRGAADRLRPQYEDKGVELNLELPVDLPLVMADRERVTQVLLNVLGNALQYTPAGGNVTVQARRQGQEVAIVVQDTGVGLAPDHLPHVFERFYRVDKSRSRAGGGSGIGLTIAKHLVEGHGGRIWVDSPGSGQGCTFVFTLPFAL